jgi:hypothetical protein
MRETNPVRGKGGRGVRLALEEKKNYLSILLNLEKVPTQI